MGHSDFETRLKASAVVITVDANAPRKGSFHRATTQATGVFPSPKLDWRKLLELRRRMPSDLPWYLKGVQCAEDALQAATVGVTGIIVSNHGGRACGDAIGSLEATCHDVPSRVAKCRATQTQSKPVEVYFDSGLRSGRDVLKALCLGARAVGLGRPYYWAAAVDGDRGAWSSHLFVSFSSCLSGSRTPRSAAFLFVMWVGEKSMQEC
ncbi:unnamed protein product [Effrenium voratum]|nr:unnamed protein product [Effrenium voratum]